MKKVSSLFLLMIALPAVASAQIIISEGQLAASGSTNIVVHTSGNLVNNNTSFDFSAVNLDVTLSGTVSTIAGNWSANKLYINTQSTTSLNGNLTITDELNFISGVIAPQNGKILFTGSPEKITTNGQSYVDGPLFQKGTGDRLFPIGTSTAYAPVKFFSIPITDEIGVEAFDSQIPPLQADNVNVLEILPGGYWQITAPDVTKINSIVNISLRGNQVSEGSPTIVQANTFNTVVENLGNSTTGADDITSRKPVTASILALGRQIEVIIKIRDLITPFIKDGVNDGLFIENITQFAVKKVYIMDRWGVLVQQWEDYTNDNNYDFSKLAPGSYICVLEYGNEDQLSKISQMVTVLKTN